MNAQSAGSANADKKDAYPGMQPQREQRTEVEQKAEEVGPFYVTFGVYLTIGIVGLAAAIWWFSQ